MYSVCAAAIPALIGAAGPPLFSDKRTTRTGSGAERPIRAANAAVPSVEQSSTTITLAGGSVWANTEASASST